MTFDEYLAAIDALAAAEGAVASDGRSYIEMTGRDCWWDAFDDGLSPDDAWSEEKLAGAS